MIDHSQLDPSENRLIEPSEDAIHRRSQEIWEREGCPEGCAQEHWLRAKAELEAQMERTSNPHLPEPLRRKGDFVRSILAQAGAMMPKASVPAAPPPLPLAAAKRPKQTTAAPSIISADIVLHGALESTGDIQLDGRVEGNVRSAGLVVDDKAVIQGDVIADDVTVRGSIRGNICARKVLLCSGARVEGDILYGTFAAEAGAQFEGYCRYVDDPLSQENAPAATREPVVPEDAVEADAPSEEVALSQTAA